ncbi:hypothetical protein DIZ81_02935 [Legionella taurinensis]|uniref:Uncharacterized protein n=1 Tax=Legionella taurinensis TaxID=70611 RepID=A0A3A5L4E2_9GAMM|nr:hypothetical protein [Legionella taurinensis]MDX1836172.1 hypothetical protein [Legionella taurinensis]PUT42060.1 hypothetical protein DB744_02940 [Legionella taurinensis]PUT44847.1 hypothetical protein DB746_02940 [Legionella taurinensis]PUT48168.1 hypothetical protein DB743_01100 [Legionella taurinensis]PUT48982.1 hypothetical protein DB745_02940 [Legionella taurinensis]
MAGKPVDYWRKEFEIYSSWNHKSEAKARIQGTVPSTWFACMAAIKLLCDYSASFRQSTAGLEGGYGINRFWAGRWGTHHGNAVREALSDMEKMATNQRSIPLLMTILKKKLDGKRLACDGDLTRILKVIQEKTGVTLQNSEEAAFNHCAMKQ